MAMDARTHSCINIFSSCRYLMRLCVEGIQSLLLLTRWRSLLSIALVLEPSMP